MTIATSQTGREAPPAPLTRADSGRWRPRRRLPAALLAGVAIVLLVVLCAAVPSLLAPYKPNQLATGALLERPSRGHLLGTDEFGRDLFSRIIWGSRTEVEVSLAGVGLALVIGVPIGLLAGYRGGAFDSIAMRIQDALLAFPAILFAILVVAAFGSSAIAIVITVAVVYVPRFARLIRSGVIVLKEQDFVVASYACGASEQRLVLRHILPNVIPPVLVQVTLAMAVAILIEAGLSYLGLGVQPPTATWGTLLQHAQQYPARAPWYVLAPGFCIFVVVLALNSIGDTLRDTLDPRLRGT